MIIRYGFSNFRSIDEYQEVSFVASALKDDQADVIELKTQELRILPAVGLYGANASGKSNTLFALRNIVYSILRSNKASPDSGTYRNSYKLRSAAKDDFSRFDIDFMCKDEHYQYGFDISDTKIETEWLYKYSYAKRKARSILFHRDSSEKNEEFYFGKSLKGKNKFLSELTLPNKLFLSVAANNNHEQIMPIYRFFKNLFNFRFEMELSEEHIAERLKDDEIKKKTSTFLKSLGTGINDILLKEEELTELELKLHKEIYSILQDEIALKSDILNKKKKNKLQLMHLSHDGESVPFEFSDESLGTRAMMSLLPSIFLTLRNGGLFIVDEIESSMHSVLTGSIIKLFNKKETNLNGAQLLFTTHESHILSGDFIRRDQIYLCEKCNKGSSYISPLIDFDIKKGDDLRKGYLEGRYGAVPYSSDLASLLIKKEVGVENG